MDMSDAISMVINKTDLDEEQMAGVMRTIMTGGATPAQIGGFLVGLRMKGETVPEITAAARVMRELAQKVASWPEYLVDTCGTGGDASGTFNISTASAFVAAGAGARVAKHGNRSISSKSGSADVLEAAGVQLDITPGHVSRCLEEVGIGFMFAPAHHGAMKHAIGPRREMGVRTIFNVLGPLTNPAGAPNQVLGVFSKDLVKPMAKVLKKLGSKHVMVVHAKDGLDEISINRKTWVAELQDGEIHQYKLRPGDFGMKRASLDSIRADSIEDSLRIINEVLDNRPGPARDIVCLNAGAAIYTAGVAQSMEQGVALAADSIASGKAREKLRQLVELTRSFKQPE